MVENFLLSILAASLPEKEDFCYFLSTNVVSPEDDDDVPATKEGFLTKRGQRLGGWKKRYFILGGLGKPVMDYFESVRLPFRGRHRSEICER